MKRSIRKVAVLGAGVMGAQIAAHLANSNVDAKNLNAVSTDTSIGWIRWTRRPTKW